MSEETRLRDLFAGAADAFGEPATPEPEAIAHAGRRAQRARHTRRTALATAAAVLVGVVAIPLALDLREDTPVDTGPSTDTAGRWTQLPDPPLAPRTDASVVWTGKEVVIVGGWEFLCPPGADCAAPTDPPFANGAAFDPRTSTWRRIADAPVGFHGLPGVSVGGDVFVLNHCAHDTCLPGERALLRYRPDADVWDKLDAPPLNAGYSLAASGGTVIAYSNSDELGEVPDWRFDLDDGTWHSLPDDPLPEVFDRQLVTNPDDGVVLVFGAEVSPESSEPTDNPNLGARFDPATEEWQQLPPSPSRGYRVWGVDGVAVLEPHFGGRGGIFDPALNTWRALPARPDQTMPDSMAGVLGRQGATFEEANGWAFDVGAGRWVEIEPISERDRVAEPDTSVAAVGRDLFVYGGSDWSGAVGALLGHAWIWYAPPPS